MRTLRPHASQDSLVLQRPLPQQRACTSVHDVCDREQRRIFDDPFPEGLWKTVAHRFSLTPRELHVARMLCQGYTNVAIAERIYVAYPTVRTYIRSINHKLGCHDRVELILMLLAIESRRQAEPEAP